MKAGDLWSALPEPALLIDAAGRIEAANPLAEAFTNRSARALVGRPVEAVLAADGRLGEALSRVRRSGASVFVKDMAIAPARGNGTGSAEKDGREGPLCTLRIAPCGDQGRMLLMIAPQDQGAALAHGQPARKAAKAAIGMAEMLAHEIKNPLAGITGAAQLLAMNLSPEAREERELTELIVSECQRVVKLLEQVEEFGNPRRPALRAINIHDALDRARRSAALGKAAKMRFREDYDPSLPLTRADPDQLQQVFLNLITNAAEAAGPQGGTITLRTHYDHAMHLRRPDGTRTPLPLQVEIIDDGPGLPPEIADDIFAPFVSGRENGTGLGLALVSKIVTDHGGIVSVESRPGRTAFRISLPVAPRGEE